MQSCGNDYIFIENFDGRITCPESLCVTLCAPHYGIGADGIVLIEGSEVANAKMRSFNRDGSEGKMAGNNIRCVAKYLYDNKIIRSEQMTIEAADGVHNLTLSVRDGRVSTVCVDMGTPTMEADKIPMTGVSGKAQNVVLTVGGTEYTVNGVSVGNPHCVVFCEHLEEISLADIGVLFEHHKAFPKRVNTEFVRVVNRRTLRVRVWERGNGATLACGTAACAAVVAAVENGYCDMDSDITVKLPGGDLTVCYTKGKVYLTGNAISVFNGELEF